MFAADSCNKCPERITSSTSGHSSKRCVRTGGPCRFAAPSGTLVADASPRQRRKQVLGVPRKGVRGPPLANKSRSRTFWKLMWLKSSVTTVRALADCAFWIILIIAAESVVVLRLSVNSFKWAYALRARNDSEVQEEFNVRRMWGMNLLSLAEVPLNHLLLMESTGAQ